MIGCIVTLVAKPLSLLKWAQPSSLPFAFPSNPRLFKSASPLSQHSTSPTSDLLPKPHKQTTNNIVVISELSRTPRRFPFATLSAPFSAHHALSPPLFRLLLWSSRQLIPQSPDFGSTRPALSPEHILRQPRPSPPNRHFQYLCHHVTILQLRWTASPVAHECAHLS